MFSEELHHFLIPVQAACLRKTLCYMHTAVSKPDTHKQHGITSVLYFRFFFTFRRLVVRRSGDFRRVGRPRT